MPLLTSVLPLHSLPLSHCPPRPVPSSYLIFVHYFLLRPIFISPLVFFFFPTELAFHYCSSFFCLSLSSGTHHNQSFLICIATYLASYLELSAPASSSLAKERVSFDPAIGNLRLKCHWISHLNVFAMFTAISATQF